MTDDQSEALLADMISLIDPDLRAARSSDGSNWVISFEDQRIAVVGREHSRALPGGQLQNVGTVDLVHAEAARKVAVFLRGASRETRSAAAPKRARCRAELATLLEALVARGVPAEMGVTAIEVPGHGRLTSLKGKDPTAAASRFVGERTKASSADIFARARLLFDRETRFVLRGGTIEVLRRNTIVARIDRFAAVTADGSFAARGDVLGDDSILVGLSQAVGSMAVAREREPEPRRRPNPAEVTETITLLAGHGISARLNADESAVLTELGEVPFTPGISSADVAVRSLLDVVARPSHERVRELVRERLGTFDVRVQVLGGWGAVITRRLDRRPAAGSGSAGR